MDGKGIRFEKVENGTPEQIEKQIRILNDSFENSILPEKPMEESFRDWLYQVRLTEWGDGK